MSYIITGILCLIGGFCLGAYIMLIGARRKVEKVRWEEEKRHQDLLNTVGGQVGNWVDIVVDIQDEVAKGHFTNRSIKDQLAIINRLVRMDRSKPEETASDSEKTEGTDTKPAESDHGTAAEEVKE